MVSCYLLANLYERDVETNMKNTLLPLTPHQYTQPLKMELIQGSETSANCNLTPGKYPEENIQ